jgi:hypothetical protein
MKNYLFLILSLCFCDTLSAQCQFGQRYSDSYLNIRKRTKIGDSSIVHIYANGSTTVFTLEKIDQLNNYQYKKDVGYLSWVKIKFDSLGRVNMYYFKYNSGTWGSAGHGTEFLNYYSNGNIKIKGWKEKKVGEIFFYDTLNHKECDAGKLVLLKRLVCIEFHSGWYIIPGDYHGLSSYGFFKRRKLVRTNKTKSRRIEINWKDGFKIDDAVVKEMMEKS